MFNAGLARTETGPLATKPIDACQPSIGAETGNRFPVALGLGLGAVVSLSLWAGIFVGIRALLS